MLDKSNYSDLSNFIRGQEISFIRYLLLTDTRWLSNGGVSEKKGFLEETGSRTNHKKSEALLVSHINGSSGPYLFS